MAPPSPLTRGFLFVDLRGFSAFIEVHGDEAARHLVRRFRTLVREQIATYSGAEIRTEGDSFYVVFTSVSHAVEAGLAIRDAAGAPGSGAQPMALGVGIHAGETTDGTEGIVSSAVNIAARLCSMAQPGEVLVSETVRWLTRTHLRASFEPRGAKHLKGIMEPVSVYSVYRTGEWRPGRRMPLPVIRVAATLVLLALVSVGIVALSTPSDAEATRTAPPAAASGQRGGSTGPTVTPTDPFPTRAEATLMAKMPGVNETLCRRATASELPAFHVDPNWIGEAPLPVHAGVSCLWDGNRVVVWHARLRSQVDEVFFQEIGRRGLTQGTCGGDTHAWQRWESPLATGNLLCWSAGEARVWWTYDHEPILAMASRRDGPDDLLSWWMETGRLINP